MNISNCAAAVKVGMPLILGKFRAKLAASNISSESFIMNVSPTSQKLNAGTCPHGNPIGSCPICAGLSGGGGGLANNKARQAGEWTYDQCYSAWQQILKAKATAEEQKLQQKLDYIKAQEKIQSFTDKITDKISALNEKAANLKTQPVNVSNFVQSVALATLNIAVNVIITAVNIVRNTFEFVQQKFIDISDKISYVCAEIKSKVQKLLSEKTTVKQKLKSLFEIFVPLNINNEDKKIDEEKILYKLKTTLASITERFKNKNKEVENDKAD